MKPTMFGGNSNFLKVDEVNNGDKITFVDEGREVLSKKFTYPALTMKGEPHPFAGQPKQEFHITISLDASWGEKKTMRINKTSYQAIAEAYGDDTASWIGKQAEIEINKLPNGNKMITLKPISQ